jgi:hypothetical protein
MRNFYAVMETPCNAPMLPAVHPKIQGKQIRPVWSSSAKFNSCHIEYLDTYIKY